MITKEDLKLLTMPFKDEILGVKVNNFSKDKTKAMLILYLQHTDVYARIEEVDPAWSCSTGTPQFVQKTIAIPMKLTIKGVSRENVGEGEDYKSAYSDAIKRAAMLFGIGRYLYDSPQVWVPYNEQTDKYKVWTIQDYRKKAPRAELSAAKKETRPKAELHNYVIKGGKYKGKKLSEIAIEEMWGYANYLEASAKEKNKPMTADAIEFVAALTAFTPENFGQ